MWHQQRQKQQHPKTKTKTKRFFWSILSFKVETLTTTVGVSTLKIRIGQRSFNVVTGFGKPRELRWQLETTSFFTTTGSGDGREGSSYLEGVPDDHF